jgi:hypothetical protein
MTWNSPHHVTPPPQAHDPLTDSGIHRALGTQVRLHLADGGTVDVGLLEISGVSTWRELAMHVSRRAPLTIDGTRRAVFAPGFIMWAEEIRDV